jgi:bacterioferritin (cytochrome b1)
MNPIRIASRVAHIPIYEGELAVPTGQLIAGLSTLLTAKYAIDVSYRSFADRVRGPWRDSLVEHWLEHAGQERQATYDIAMRIVGFGADPIQQAIQIPACVPNVFALSKCLMQQELDALKAERELITMSGDHTSMKVFMENQILLDTQHLDDLRRMCAKMEDG